MVTVDQALAQGTRHHQAGQLAEAERIYRQVLAVEPGNAEALHLLGTLALQSGRNDTAIELINQAIARDRTQPAYHANLGEVYRQLGKHAEAIENYRKALKLDPGMANVHCLLGTVLQSAGKPAEAALALREALRLQPEYPMARARLGHVLQDLNKLPEAEACFRRVLRSEGHVADAHFNLGSVLQFQNKLNEAAACYRAALALRPDHPDAQHNLATVLQGQGKFDEADVHYRAALAARPDFAVTHLSLGTNHHARDQFEEAVACYRTALRLQPHNLAARAALGSALLRLGQSEEALAAFQETIRAQPEVAVNHLNAGNALQMVGRLDAAVTCFQEAIRLNPNYPDAHSNLGMVLNDLGRRDEALAACRRAIEIDPEFAQAYNNLAVAALALGRVDEAVANARRSAELSPESSPHHSNLLYMLNYQEHHDKDAIFAEHRNWGRTHADPLSAKSPPHPNDRTPGRRLRLGYVSAHFYAHAVNFFTEPILASHDHSQFEVFCYSRVDREDEITRRLRTYADQWRDVSFRTDETASEMVRRDQIDILVDLTGHIGGNRLLVFARKPAPIQVTYIGYQNTTGMAAMDYRLTDDWSDPSGTTDAFYTETLVRLPRSFFCYQPSADAPPVNPLPALERGYVTFGSFNNFAKVTPEVLATWARLLAAVPDSRLTLLANAVPSLREYFDRTFAAHGIRPDRVTLADRRPRGAYLELISQVDLALDPFPFNGHTTTCDALWQGVPVVTLAGDSYVSRFGSSALVTLGLDDLIARTPEEYVEIAARLAGDRNRLQTLRAELRPRMAASALLDFAGFTRNLEAAYRQMWTDWCARQSP